MITRTWTPAAIALSAQLCDAIGRHHVDDARKAMDLGADPGCPFDEACVDNAGAPLTPAMKACGPNLPPEFFPVLFGTNRAELPLALSGPKPVLLTDAIVEHCAGDQFQAAFTMLLTCMDRDAPLSDAIWKGVVKLSNEFSYDNLERSDGGPALAAARAAELLSYGGMPADISEAVHLFQLPIVIKNGPPLEFAEFAMGKAGVMQRFLAQGFPADFLVYGMPLLHYAAYKAIPTVAQELLIAGADMDVLAAPSRGALDYLRARNPDVQIPEMLNALDMARLRGASLVAEVIEAYKAKQAIESVLVNHRSKVLS